MNEAQEKYDSLVNSKTQQQEGADAANPDLNKSKKPGNVLSGQLFKLIHQVLIKCFCFSMIREEK
jgi:hypothetical protein